MLATRNATKVDRAEIDVKTRSIDARYASGTGGSRSVCASMKILFETFTSTELRVLPTAVSVHDSPQRATNFKVNSKSKIVLVFSNQAKTAPTHRISH
jgi:fructoselysine-6-P-deglycase FrlB-like protein